MIIRKDLLLQRGQHNCREPGKSTRVSLRTLFLVIVVFLAATQAATLTSTGVSVDPNTVNAASTLNLRSTLATVVPAGGRLVLTLPSSMSVSTATALTCAFTEPASLAITSCSYVGNVITLTLGGTQLTNSFFQVDISNVVNPPSTTQTPTFLFRTEDSSGTILDQQTSNIILVASSGSLSSITFTPTSQVVGETTTLAVSFKNTHTLIAGGKIKVTFPKWNPGALLASQRLSMIETGFAVTSVSTNLNSGSLTATFTNDVLTISNAITADIAGGSTVSFTVTNFKNPISTATHSGFSIDTTDSSDGVIDSGSGTIRITTSSAVYNAAFSASTTSQVQENSVFRVTFQVPVPLESGCIVEIKFPSDFTSFSINEVRGYSLFGGPTVKSGGSFNAGSNTYTLPNSCTDYVASGTQGIIDFDSIENPMSTRPTGSVEIYVKDSSQFLIGQLTTGITHTSTTGTITGISLTPDNTIVSTTTSATIKFLPAHNLLDNESRIVITLPSDVSIADQSSTATCSISDLQFISPTVTCTVISNVITLIDPFSVNYISTSSEILQFKVAGMTMPPSLKPPGNLVVTTKIGSGSTFYDVDTASASGNFVATVGSMTDYSATPSNFLAYIQTTYTFTFKPQHNILQNGYVTVDLPTQISIPDAATSASSCASIAGFLTTISCAVSGSRITISNGFTSANLAAGTSISFSINGVLNPVSLSTSSSFTFTTYDSSNYQIDVRSSGITVTMTSVGELERVQLSAASLINGATNAYTFTFRASSPLKDGDRIYIKVPNSITPPLSPTCAGILLLSSSLSCNTLNKEIFVTISAASGSTIDARQDFSFSISGFVNPSSTRPTDALTFEAQDSTGSSINTYTSAIVVTITTSVAAPITTSSISNENKFASQSTTLYLNFTTIHEIPQNGIIIVEYPTEISPFNSAATTITCSLNIAANPTCTHTSASRTIQISNILTSTFLAEGTEVRITLNEMKNPSTSTPTSSFKIGTYEVASGTNYIIDQATTGLTISSNCNFPCRTCDATDKSKCSSCLLDSSGNTLYLQTTTSGGTTTTTCVSSCNTDYVEISGVCEACENNCGACLSTNKGSCTQCGKAAAQFLVGDRCTNNCPSGTYGNTSTNKCVSCVFPCQTCTSSTSCESCAEFDTSGNPSSLVKLESNTCKASCTADLFVDINDVCTPCSSSCSKCSERIDICTECTSPLILDKSTSSCQPSCPVGTTIQNIAANTCEICNTNCATCAGTVNTCSSCNSGLLLTTSNTCATSCLTTDTFVNGSNQCVKCATGCTSCSGLANYCDKCDTASGYLFANFTCVTSCPSDFSVDISDTTRCILEGLQCPFGYSIDSSGTQCEPSSVVCRSGYKVNNEKTKCIPEPGSTIPFPFFIVFIVMAIVIAIGSLVHRQQMITTCLIKAIAILEIPYLIVQIYSAVYISSWGICIGTIIALVVLIAIDIVFYIIYSASVVKDNAYKHWKDKYRCATQTISVLSLLMNFKIFRCLYSKFYGVTTFNAPFERSTLFYRPLVVMTIIYLLFVLIPIIIVDIVTFYFVEWGYQLLIVAIESFVFSILMIILSFIEFFQIKRKVFKDDEEDYLSINPKMFDNAYTAAGGIPPHDPGERVGTHQRVKGMTGLEESSASHLYNSYSYNGEKYQDKSNLSSIGFITRFNSGKGIISDAQREDRMNLHNIVNQLNKKNPIFESGYLNIMDLKDNAIFKRRKDYDPNVMLADEEDFDQCDRKFLRRSVSFEDFREHDDTFAPNKRELIEEKCISYPPSPREMQAMEHYLFGEGVELARDKLKAEYAYNNIYADREGEEFDPEDEFGKIRARKVQTYGTDAHTAKVRGTNEDLDDVEVDPDLANSILDGVLGNLSDDDDDRNNQLVRRTKRERMALAQKRKMEIPDFAIEDIMGEFDIDDQGNYIIIRNEENGNLEDKNERRVNKRGYLIDEDGNIIDKYGNLIFKEREIDSDDEIPPPYSFEKRKMQLLNPNQKNIEEYELADLSPEDDDHIWMDPKGKDLAESLSGDETPVESLMGETPGYLQDKTQKTKSRRGLKNSTINEENINLDLESQKDTVKLGSSKRLGSKKSSNKTKRMISARVKGITEEPRPGTTYDGYVRDVPFYMQNNTQIGSKKATPKRRRPKKKGFIDDSLKRIYGNIDPFLYRDDSKASGVRLDKVTDLKMKKKQLEPFKLAESAEVNGKLGMIGSDEEVTSEMNRYSRLERVPSKYQDRSTFGESVNKSKLNDLEEIYARRGKLMESDFHGKRSLYDTRIPRHHKNSMVNRNVFTADTGAMRNKRHRKQFNNSRPSVDNVTRQRGIEEGGWI
ncbi:unnamed protein product [Moneuplotes crassus]|uniref:Uncharacterized protein n=3 Tax=Euplotes crassus TaxID=5936 RepID=A0AAD2D186_EUPCR|nr:unnamed protein product [Moneuplotes crassus]